MNEDVEAVLAQVVPIGAQPIEREVELGQAVARHVASRRPPVRPPADATENVVTVTLEVRVEDVPEMIRRVGPLARSMNVESPS